jgi:hypothetical protein
VIEHCAFDWMKADAAIRARLGRAFWNRVSVRWCDAPPDADSAEARAETERGAGWATRPASGLRA